MKMKSKFLGFNASLALILIAICGVFAGCYEKEDLDVSKPGETTAPVYTILGAVQDGTNGGILAGVTVSIQGGDNVTTGANGVYTLKAKVGQQVITFAKDGYKTVVTSVYVTEGENGKVYNYPVDATLYKGETEPTNPTYKKNQYNVEATLYDATTGAKLTVTPNVTVTGITAGITKEAGKFNVTNIAPGTYVAEITATGYTATHATILVSSAEKVEGAESEINTVVTYVAVNMQKTDNATAKYYLQGNIKSAKTGVPITDAAVSINLISGVETTPLTPAYNDGFYSVEIPSAKVVPTTRVQVTVTKAEYYPTTISSLVIPVASNQTSLINIDVQLTPMSQIVNGSGSSDVITGSTVGTEAAAAAPGNIQDILTDLGFDISKANVTTVATAQPKTMELISFIADDNSSTGETVEQIDQVVIPTGTIYYTNSEDQTSAPVAQNITITRESKEERAIAGIRVFTGKPEGTVFGAPITFTFTAPTTEPDYLLSMSYYNEETKKWTVDAGNFAKYTVSGFVGKVNHFSKFKFGFASDVTTEPAVALDPINYTKACYTGSAAQTIIVNGTYPGGLKYVDKTPELAIKAAVPSLKDETVKYISGMFLNMIKANYANMTPTPNYTDTNFSTSMIIDAYQQVSGFTLKRNEETKSYSITVVTNDEQSHVITVKVSKVTFTELMPNAVPNHGHGHGHGDDLNAGGGIVTLD